jgi:hypothetical protein
VGLFLSFESDRNSDPVFPTYYRAATLSGWTCFTFYKSPWRYFLCFNGLKIQQQQWRQISPLMRSHWPPIWFYRPKVTLQNWKAHTFRTFKIHVIKLRDVARMPDMIILWITIILVVYNNLKRETTWDGKVSIGTEAWKYTTTSYKFEAPWWVLVNREVLREGQEGWPFLVHVIDISATTYDHICPNKRVILRISCESVKLKKIQDLKRNITKKTHTHSQRTADLHFIAS